MADLTPLDEKIGEVLGLAQAAQDATTKVAQLADDGETKQVLERMHAEATETRERCEAALDRFDGKKTAIQDKARETKGEAQEMMRTYLSGDEVDALDGFEFLVMAEAGELGHWEIVREMNERVGDPTVRELTEFAIPIQQRHFEEHASRAALLHATQERADRPLALIADLQGPKLRVGRLGAPRELVTGERVTVVGEEPQDGELPVSPPVLSQVLRPGDQILIDDGLVRLRVDGVNGGRVQATVMAGGAVAANKGVNVPGVPLPVPSVTEKDVADLEFALGLGVDYVALSFVRSANDVRQLRELLHDAGSKAQVIAKIEKAEALDDLGGIVRLSDAVMVARGDLGVEIGPAEVPLVQKRILLGALERGKPAITATQMLESMVNQPEPTRAEASDVANAVLDGTSAVMLSGETAVGKYPLEAVRTMDKISRAVEPSLPYRHELDIDPDEPYATVGEAMSNAACDISEALDARAILVPTFSGRTASAVARHRPKRPVIAVTHHVHAAQQLAIEWGVVPRVIPQCDDVEELWARTLEAARASGIVAPGDRVVITAGTAVNIPGSTNLIKVETA